MKISGVMLFLATLLAHTGYAAAEAPNVRPPVNATAQSYGTWWTCNIGIGKLTTRVFRSSCRLMPS
jgi:hypothetical protein